MIANSLKQIGDFTTIQREIKKRKIKNFSAQKLPLTLLKKKRIHKRVVNIYF